jgi:hypothetical protein
MTAENERAYDKIDRYLRANLGDADYAEYSAALESVLAAFPAPTAAPEAPTAEPCPRGADKPEPTCTNRHQCWEPCGELGHSAEHAVVHRPAVERVALPTPSEQPTGDEWLKEHDRLLDEYGHARWNTGCSETSFDKLGAHRAEAEADEARTALLAHARLRAAAGGEAVATDAVCCAECGKKHADGWALYCVECALNIAPAFSTELPASLKIDLTEDAAKFLRDTLNSGGDDTPDITLALTNGHSGYGLYQWETEYPEEGANLVQAIAIHTTQAGAAPRIPAAQVDSFAAWFRKNCPAGTVIGDPDWWSVRILNVITNNRHAGDATNAADGVLASGEKQ